MAIVPFETKAAYWYGKTRTDMEHRAILIGDADLRIAAIALARGLTVVTGNNQHFRRVPGLPVENWLEP